MIDWIVDCMLENGYPPIQQEIADHFDVHYSTAKAWLAEAKGLGLLETAGSGRARAIMVPGVYYVDNRNGDYVPGFKIGEGT